MTDANHPPPRDGRRPMPGAAAGPLVAVALTLALACTARADDVLLMSNDGRSPGTTVRDVTVLRVDGDDLVYRTPGGEQRQQPITKIFAVRPSNDASFAAAEDAYVAKRYGPAVDEYLKVARGGEGWKVRWVVPRLIDAATRANRFDAALAGYVAVARIDPAAASTLKPALPARGSKFLDDAARDLATAVRAATKDAERQALLSLLLDVQLARGDLAGAEASADQLLKLAGASADDPTLVALVGEVRLGQARVAAEARRWADVTKAIDAAAPRLVEPRQQAEALYLRAAALAGATRADDRPAQLDAALAFMRVVAHFREVEGRPFVGQALLGASDALEAAGDAAAAGALREQLVAEMPDTPHAAEAARRIARPPAAK